MAGLALAALAAAVASPQRAVAGPPPGFAIEPIVAGFDQPTAFAHAPDGRIFVAERPGVVKVAVDGVVVSTFIDLRDRVNEYWNRGLIGMALDPHFAENGRVYLAFSEELNPGVPDGPLPAGGVIVRVQTSAANSNVADPSTETTLLTGFQSAHFSHSVGALRFDAGGRLLAALGDGASFFEVDRLALAAQDISSLQGKIVRIDPETGHGVPDNPHFDPADPAAVQSRVLARGLRNPYRFTVDPETGDIWLGDVGWTTRDELNRLPTGPGTPAGELNFGWPCAEGVDLQELYVLAFPSECRTFLAGGWHRPDHHWRTGASAATGGPLYRGSAYPQQYRGQVFFADFSSDQMMTFAPGAGVASDFGPPEGWGGPVDIQIGPDGNIHYLAFFDGALKRLAYTGATPLDLREPAGPAADTDQPAPVAWSPARRVSRAKTPARFPDIATNARGQSVASWVERRGGRLRVVASLRSANGSWTAATPISPRGQTARDPSVAIGPRGHVLVSWRRLAGRRRAASGKLVPVFVIDARRAHARQQRWRLPAAISDRGSLAGPPDAAVDRDGTTLVVWRGRSLAAGTPEVAGSVGRPGRALAGGQTIVDPRACEPSGRPEVAVSPVGRGLAWWSCGSSALAVADRSPSSGAFAAARQLALPGRGRVQASVTVEDSGALFAVAARSHGRSPIHALARPSSKKPLVRAADLAGGGSDATTVEAAGEALVAWRNPASEGGLRVAAAGRSGPPANQSTLDADRRVSAPAVALADGGVATVAWIRGAKRAGRAPGHGTVVASSRVAAGGPWASPSALSRPGIVDGTHAPALAVDGSGRATALWSRRVGKHFVIERAELRPAR